MSKLKTTSCAPFTRVLNLFEYFAIQDSLNKIVVNDWKNQMTVYHYKTAILEEVYELLDNFNWKWWKKQDDSINLWNMRIELVDILHFALSSMMIEKNYNDVNFVFLGNEKYKVNRFRTKFNHELFFKSVLEFLSDINENTLENFIKMFGLSSEELSAIYVAKATLNEIRQINGYKSGEYKKYLNGKEDNEFLFDHVLLFLGHNYKNLRELSEGIVKFFGV